MGVTPVHTKRWARLEYEQLVAVSKRWAATEGPYSIRINDQWRICFEWPDGSAGPVNVEIVDYH